MEMALKLSDQYNFEKLKRESFAKKDDKAGISSGRSTGRVIIDGTYS